ncbi:hypothetical protein [Bacillus mycoides]|uniref:hypothetical protein n=1 Tax=Bacillus mycoides TaxID=1405 RepID=UPI000BFB7916|nr:hypothetical protein [Bacillus mycoides]MCQ6530973.1 hypothetical protein [Bacillus mycoides]PGT66517.1 hypothetical protein COD14_20630 [Bacillus cereus]
MKSVAKKVQMIRFQEEHCKRQADTELYCDEQCKIERECIKLDKKTVKNKTTAEKWDERCKQAVQLFNQGTEYPDIAKKMGCNLSSLYRELKKRGVLQNPKQVASSKSLKPPIIPPQTKKSKFERYKEHYMYK